MHGDRGSAGARLTSARRVAHKAALERALRAERKENACKDVSSRLDHAYALYKTLQKRLAEQLVCGWNLGPSAGSHQHSRPDMRGDRSSSPPPPGDRTSVPLGDRAS
jgi:hypothetical protein